ncbi:MAG: enoyl-CoA hydratase [Desulforhopalus sp.]|jgi:enoyl-CoA hydratase
MNNLIVEKDNKVTTVTINRPKSLNALNKETLEELLSCFQELSLDMGTRAIILTGSGEKAFVAGADISYMQNLSAHESRLFGQLGHLVMKTIENTPQPVIAAINGFALGGGCELALACDMRFASDNAKFGQPEVNLGVVPGFGGTQRLPRLIGKGLANELLLTGNIIDCNEALRIGLVNRIFSQEDLLVACRKIADTICMKGPVAVRLCKEAVNNGIEMDLTRGCSYEADLFALCFASDEQKEGMTAFLEKRAPKFEG